MAYVPPPYNNIIFGEEVASYTPPLYNNIIFNEDAADGAIGRYAIVYYENGMITISSALLGTGLQPIVVENDGSIHTRETTEGTPIVIINDEVCTLPETEYLLI